MDALQSIKGELVQRIDDIVTASERIEQENVLLPLDLPERIVRLRNRDTGATGFHVFNPVTRAVVDGYFSSMNIATERKGRDSVEYEIDMGTPKLKFYERAIKRVMGYSLPDGQDLMTHLDWKKLVPGTHQLRAADIFLDVKESKDDSRSEFCIDPAAETVLLDAFWSAGNHGNARYSGLVHRFSHPTIVHWRKLNNQRTRTTAQAGSRSQRTTYPKLNGVCIELYDELISSVEGYSVGGLPVGDREQCVSHMDCFHKIEAITALFAKPTDPEGEELEEA